MRAAHRHASYSTPLASRKVLYLSLGKTFSTSKDKSAPIFGIFGILQRDKFGMMNKFRYPIPTYTPFDHPRHARSAPAIGEPNLWTLRFPPASSR